MDVSHPTFLFPIPLSALTLHTPQFLSIITSIMKFFTVITILCATVALASPALTPSSNAASKLPELLGYPIPEDYANFHPTPLDLKDLDTSAALEAREHNNNGCCYCPKRYPYTQCYGTPTCFVSNKSFKKSEETSCFCKGLLTLMYKDNGWWQKVLLFLCKFYPSIKL